MLFQIEPKNPQSQHHRPTLTDIPKSKPSVATGSSLSSQSFRTVLAVKSQSITSGVDSGGGPELKNKTNDNISINVCLGKLEREASGCFSNLHIGKSVNLRGGGVCLWVLVCCCEFIKYKFDFPSVARTSFRSVHRLDPERNWACAHVLLKFYSHSVGWAERAQILMHQQIVFWFW